MALEDNKHVIRRHYGELFNGRRLEMASEITAEDYIEHGVAPLRTSRARAAEPIESLRDTVRWLTSAFPDLHIEIDDMVAEGDKVLAYITMRGTHEGEFQGKAPTGRSFEARALVPRARRQGRQHWGGERGPADAAPARAQGRPRPRRLVASAPAHDLRRPLRALTPQARPDSISDSAGRPLVIDGLQRGIPRAHAVWRGPVSGVEARRARSTAGVIQADPPPPGRRGRVRSVE